MKRYNLLMAALIAVAPMSAQAQRIPNLSMSDSEMLDQGIQYQQPKNNGGGGGGAMMPGKNMYPAIPSAPIQNGLPAINAPVSAAQMPQGGNYMDNYCDQNYRPMIAQGASYANMAQCLEQQRQQACQLYRDMPPEARRVVDDTMNCMSGGQFSAGGLVEMPDGTLQPAASQNAGRNCDATNAARLQAVARYWGDQVIAYSLIFIPELALDLSGSCMGGRR